MFRLVWVYWPDGMVHRSLIFHPVSDSELSLNFTHVSLFSASKKRGPMPSMEATKTKQIPFCHRRIVTDKRVIQPHTYCTHMYTVHMHTHGNTHTHTHTHSLSFFFSLSLTHIQTHRWPPGSFYWLGFGTEGGHSNGKIHAKTIS